MFVVSIENKIVSADEIQEVLDQYSLTGEELDKFEENEQKELKSFSINAQVNLLEEYQKLQEEKLLSEDITYDIFLEMKNTPPPTDKVAEAYRNNDTRPQAGDIMITNGTSAFGLTGHAGIFLGNGTILSIAGPGSNPEALGILEWSRRYNSEPGDWTKIYRPSSIYQPSLAESWAKNHYLNKKFSYGITTDLFSENPTYCSKIVWQAYFYASGYGQMGYKQPLTKIALPYNLIDYFDTTPIHVATWGG